MPAERLMGSFSYRAKFVIISLLSVTPALIMTVDILLNLSSRLDQAHQAQADLNRLHTLARLAQPMETLRDLGVRGFMTGTQDTDQQYLQAKAQLHKQLDRLRLQEVLLTRKLESVLDGQSVPPGSEGFRIVQVFQNAHRAVELLNDQSREIASTGALSQLSIPGVGAMINLLTRDFARLTRAMGEARALGAYYLSFPYLDSSGASQVDAVFSGLDYEITQLSLSMQQPELETLGPEVHMTRVIEAARRVHQDLDASLIQVVDLTTPWQDYFQRTSTEMGVIYDAVDAEYRYLETVLFREVDARLRSLVLVSVVLLLIAAGYVYLLSGLYSNVRSSVRHLSRSAHRIAQGDYNTPINVPSRDETRQIAKALEAMRDKLRERDQQLREFSLTDGLTGLRNRTYFDEALASGFARSARQKAALTLLLIDVDHFKKINDQNGHLKGDRVLQHLAMLMQQIIQRESDVIARFGGEEFVILLPDTEAFEGRILAERLRGHVEAHPYVDQSASIAMTISIGVACTPVNSGEATSAADLVRRADEALYAAKHAGRNQVQLDPDSQAVAPVVPV